VVKRAIPGHPFGLKLAADDKAALIALQRCGNMAMNEACDCSIDGEALSSSQQRAFNCFAPNAQR
jgi:hypothetical protein